ncbi:hypothetical protein [Intrasporangium sp.]|uniref:hypothetical protein n=1 Tax=Intrasporangium sp. TaxID=1925024 RepID=UPI00293A6D0C|nr:hypothetical protein [Intrasporangium sp.]MDV3222377.1 hypothetical protein [Intrasporangium sp.]
MSRSTGFPRQAQLFDHLVDDAAVFPPGLAPVDVAVHEHLDLRDGPYAAALGPLLLPAAAAPELADLAAADPRTGQVPLRVGLIVRPGGALGPLVDAVGLLRQVPAVTVASVEVGWGEDWRRTLDLDLPVVVEVGLDPERQAGLDEIEQAIGAGADVRAKFRTGQTPTWTWPDETALAGFLDEAARRGLAFKLTGGLHHVVRGDYAGEPMHGLLNVLVATHDALDGGRTTDLARVLAVTDVEHLVDRVTALDDDAVSRLRASFTGFGCCGVLDPLTELEALGLLPERHTA